MAQCKVTLKVLFIGSVMSFFITIIILMTEQLPKPKKLKCVSSRGCDIDFAAKVRLRDPFQDDPKRKVISAKYASNADISQDIVEIENFYKEEIQKMESQLENLRKALDAERTNPEKKMARNNCSSLVVNDSVVRSCITSNMLGKVPFEMQTRPFKVFQGGSPEHTEDRQASFQEVFTKKAWGQHWDSQNQGLGVSGMGATLPWAQEAMATLDVVISDIKRDLGISRIKMLDVPCGDMAWMSRFLKTRDDIDYTGIDIVPDLITKHKENFKYFPWKFETRDIVAAPINESYHLILCRTLLQHLYYHDAMSVLDKFSSSGSHFLLVTTWSRHKLNQELQMAEWNPGRMRRLNLELPPVSLPPPLCLQRDGPPDAIEGWDHFLGLWKLPLSQVIHCEDIFSHNLPRTAVEIHACVDWVIS